MADHAHLAFAADGDAHRRALVLFSGGQDSTACLAHALACCDHVETVGFDYGQRHQIEMTQRGVVREQLCQVFPALASKLGPDHVLDASVLGTLGETALTQAIQIQMQTNSLPNTFVPGRNLLFLILAGALAYRRGLTRLVTGVCETDFSGYPDCRDDTIKAMQLALNLGMDQRFYVDTPLMWRNKAGVWAFTHQLGEQFGPGGQGGRLITELVLEHTHTCYLGERQQRHPWGYGCQTCPACELRAKGWEQWVRFKCTHK